MLLLWSGIPKGTLTTQKQKVKRALTMRTLKNNMQIKPWGISHSVSAQLSGGEKSKSNSYNKEQTNKGEAKKNRN